MKQLLRKWLVGEPEDLRPRLEEAERERDSLRERAAQFAAEHQSRLAEIYRLKSELLSTREKLREQTDADLLLVSAKIIAATLRGDKPEPADVTYQRQLIAQQQNLQMNQYVTGGLAGLGGIFSKLGIQNMFRPH